LPGTDAPPEYEGSLSTSKNADQRPLFGLRDPTSGIYFGRPIVRLIAGDARGTHPTVTYSVGRW
jgi:hypothetical protein